MIVIEPLADKERLLAYLQGERLYAAYAIGDLEPALFGDCTWFGVYERDALAALVMLYAGLDPPILFLMGAADALAAALPAMTLPERVYVTCRRPHLPALESVYEMEDLRAMRRMAANRAAFRPPTTARQAQRLNVQHVPDLLGLYALGGPHAPDAFDARQVATGLFYGLFEDGALLAAAGTHLVAPTYGLAAVGNIYTHPAHRGRGYARVVTAALTADLLARGWDVVLNVHVRNEPAFRLYETLGYRTHCHYLEAPARRRQR